MWIAVIVVVVLIIYLYSIAPNMGRREKMKPFSETFIAHRGLFNNGDGEWLVKDSDGNLVRREEVVNAAYDKSGSTTAGNQQYKMGVTKQQGNEPYGEVSDSGNQDEREEDKEPGDKAAADVTIPVAPENSMPAFQAAVAAGYGIELDTQTTADGRLVVFHDENLYRMCGIDKNLYECTYDELRTYKLAKTEYGIPLFEDVLKMIDGKVPLVVEIKSEGNWKRTTRMTAEALDAYGVSVRSDIRMEDSKEEKKAEKREYNRQPYCMESFHPFIVKWFRDNRPDVLRGQLSTNFFRSTLKRVWYENIVLTNLMLNFLSRPDFVAYNYRYKNQPSFWLCRNLFGVVSAAWTVRSEAALEKVAKVFEVIIFDSFLPEER